MNLLMLTADVAILRPLWLPVAGVLLALALLLRERPEADGWARVLSPGVWAFLRGMPSPEAAGDPEHTHPVPVRMERSGEAAGDPPPDRPGRRPRVDTILLSAALLALALAAPATRRGDADTWRHASGWIVVADVSRSMTLDDTVPSRLAALRETALALSTRAGARPLALVLFAGDAFLVAPPAFDRRLVEEHAALLDHGVVPVDGSNLARALSLAADVATGSRLVGARVFVLGDSGGTGVASEAAARHLASEGHRVDIVTFGSDTGRLPVDAAASRRLAGEGGGRWLAADAFGQVDLDGLDLAAGAEPESVRGLETLLWQDRSHWLLLAGLPLMLSAFRRVRT